LYSKTPPTTIILPTVPGNVTALWNNGIDNHIASAHLTVLQTLSTERQNKSTFVKTAFQVYHIHDA
jgi:hypothetical protein